MLTFNQKLLAQNKENARPSRSFWHRKGEMRDYPEISCTEQEEYVATQKLALLAQDRGNALLDGGEYWGAGRVRIVPPQWG